MLFIIFSYISGLFYVTFVSSEQSTFFVIYKFSSGGKSKCYIRIHIGLKLEIRKKLLQWWGNFCCITSLLYATQKNNVFIELDCLLNCERMTKHDKNGVVKKDVTYEYVLVQVLF